MQAGMWLVTIAKAIDTNDKGAKINQTSRIHDSY